MELNDKLNAYLQTPAGKRKVEQARKAAVKSGEPFGTFADGSRGTGQTAGISRTQYQDIIDDLIECVMAWLPTSLRGSALEKRDSYIVKSPRRTSTGEYKISIVFAPDVVFRPSVAPDGPWGAGVENIVVHLSNGWHAKGSVRGEWHGQDIMTRQIYRGDDFMEQAIREFNMTHAGVIAQLGPEYDK